MYYIRRAGTAYHADSNCKVLRLSKDIRSTDNPKGRFPCFLCCEEMPAVPFKREE